MQSSLVCFAHQFERASTVANIVIFEVYDWKSLPKNSVIVDVGGGVGASTLALAQEFPELNYVVQDLPGTIQEAKGVTHISMNSSSLNLI